jgi:hypothetical protein
VAASACRPNLNFQLDFGQPISLSNFELDNPNCCSIRFETLIPSTTSQAADEKPPSRNRVAEVPKRISDGHIDPTTCLRNVPALPTQIARLYV